MDKAKRVTQAERILDLLESANGWVSLPRILELGIASHTRRIHELRRAGHVILKRELWVGRNRRVWYRTEP